MQDSLGDQTGAKMYRCGVGQPSDENTDDEEEEDPFAFGSDAANDGEDDDSGDEEEVESTGRRLRAKGMHWVRMSEWKTISGTTMKIVSLDNTQAIQVKSVTKLMKSKIVMAALDC